MGSIAARSRRALGAYGEELAAQRLVSAGMEILARNWRCSAGEVDVVALDGKTLVIVEVKTRRSTRFGSPIEAVNAEKLARLRRLASAWFAEHPSGRGARRFIRSVRIDVVAIWMNDSGPARIEHLVGVS
ncbi:YraN family protein [Dermatophilus congolensis]|uniref:UPF0102 protein SAMEA4475696_01087 n=1 Tax=Dermatophilus congolensis TaxID=1863 RepID=A0A239VGB0_9MICO|nr:YraN family protein [Dermatophilus congolensis]MBO3128845.1 YraN family protein [Dermatophilus congolensis]MBO3132517.1 YraN family protein [Dermatophilus congolensis]MBO3133322.1 YraN family protein [Dermatophilus congolensis]MBO3135557.1 YraN family protein [Dermatophilus congolensis]MBO3137796.1 YraN family protein [Dermatophilus congolensis]